MDSREYRFIFPLSTPADIPSDFRSSVQGLSFETGVFLPQDDTNWFTRCPEYPARLLLLRDRALSIIPHPTSGRPAVELGLDDLIQLETGTVLLRGWIDLTTQTSEEHLAYNTRASLPLEQFLAVLRQRWLPEPHSNPGAGPSLFGGDLNVKFRSMSQHTLDRNERILSQFYAGPLEFVDKFLVFRRMEFRPGNLIALTSANRLLRVTDEYKGRCERYAGIVLSVPTALFEHSAIERAIDHQDILIKFASDIAWRISIYSHDRECEEFSRALNSCLAGNPSSTYRATSH